MDGVRRIAHQHETRVEVAMRVQRAERIAPAAAHHAHRAEMAAEPAGDRIGEARIVQRQHALRDRRALGPDDGGDVGRAAFQRVGAGAHRQLRERAGRQEMLERRVVVRMLVADRADDAGLVVRQMGDRNAGRPSQRRVAALRRHHEAAVDARDLRRCARWRPSSRRSTSAVAGANTRSAGSACMCAFSATRRLRASTMWPNAASPRARDGRNAGTAARRAGRGGHR